MPTGTSVSVLPPDPWGSPVPIRQWEQEQGAAGTTAQNDRLPQKGCFADFSERDRRSCLSLAMDLLGHHGNSMDASLVRGWAQDQELGRSAISALKSMEARE